MSKRNDFFYFENPNNGKDVKIYHDEIMEVADSREDFRLVEDMDDETFHFYCEIVLENR